MEGLVTPRRNLLAQRETQTLRGFQKYLTQSEAKTQIIPDWILRRNVGKHEKYRSLTEVGTLSQACVRVCLSKRSERRVVIIHSAFRGS